jgi:hypothetical protein
MGLAADSRRRESRPKSTVRSARARRRATCVLLCAVLGALPVAAQGRFDYQNWGGLSPSAGWEIFSGQFVGDSAPDLVAYLPTTGELRVVTNAGSSFLVSPAAWFVVTPSTDWRFASGEFTSDALDDLVGYHPSNGTVWVLRNTGTGFASELRGSLAAGLPGSIHAGDFDGNGSTDVAYYASSTGAVRVGASTGSTFTFSLWYTLTPASAWTLTSAELTGDARIDLAGYHPSTGALWIGTSTGASFIFAGASATLAPASGWNLVGGDFASSALADLFSYHTGTGTLWVGLNAGGAFTYQAPWSPTPVSPATSWQFVPGDFDADGRLDVAGYHPSNGSLWAMLQVDPPPLGYAWPLSGAPGESIDFMISAGNGPAVDFYRHVSTGADVTSTWMGSAPFTPVIQSCAPNANRFGCGWAPTVHFVIPAGWPSGLYSARIPYADGPSYDVTFVVKPTPTAYRNVAVVANANTWNAYNDWGGGSKYSGVERGSFLRPSPGSAPIGESFANHHLTRAELWMLGWLEAEGYAPHLFTDLDVHNGEIGTLYDQVVLSAHPEYWTLEMYDWLQAHLVAGGSLLYVAGNGIYEKTTYANDQRELVFLGGVPGGAREPELFRRQPGRAERSLLGVATEDCGVAPAPFVVLDAGHPLFAGTGVTNGLPFGTSSFNTGGGSPSYSPGRASAWEVDSSAGPGAIGGGCNGALPPIPPSILPAGLQVVARAANPSNPARFGAEIVYYDHPAGGRVVSIGSLTASGSLVIDPVLQQIARNALVVPEAGSTLMLAVGCLVLGALDSPGKRRPRAPRQRSHRSPFHQ